MNMIALLRLKPPCYSQGILIWQFNLIYTIVLNDQYNHGTEYHDTTMINVQKNLFFERNRLFQGSLVWSQHIQYVTIICLYLPVLSNCNTQMSEIETPFDSTFHTLHSVPQRMTHNDPQQQLKELSSFPENTCLMSSHWFHLMS